MYIQLPAFRRPGQFMIGDGQVIGYPSGSLAVKTVCRLLNPPGAESVLAVGFIG